MSKYFESNFNCKEAIKKLNELSEKFKDLTPLMRTARVFLKNTVNENFETEGEYSGEKWQEWSESYKKERLKKGKAGGKILTLEGHLRREIKAKSGEDYAMLYTNKIYAAIHNFGYNGYIKRKTKKGNVVKYKLKMPKRQYMRLSDYNKEELLAELYIKAEEMAIDSMHS